MIKKWSLIILSKLLQGLAMGFFAAGVFGAVWNIWFSADPLKYGLLALCIGSCILGYLIHRFAILKVHDDRLDHDRL